MAEAKEKLNSNYVRATDAFEADDGPIYVRDRKGTCDECGQVMDATEKRNGSAVIVEGTCANCGWSFSRAGLVSEPEEAEEA